MIVHMVELSIRSRYLAYMEGVAGVSTLYQDIERFQPWDSCSLQFFFVLVTSREKSNEMLVKEWLFAIAITGA